MEGFKQCKRCTMGFMLCAPAPNGLGYATAERSVCSECSLPFWHAVVCENSKGVGRIRVGVLPKNAHMIPQKRTA
jgi:hypothetical protein